ncbi:MAG: Rieske 2Fe-2S domain-containing protein [Pseudomonadota bacterium]
MPYWTRLREGVGYQMKRTARDVVGRIPGFGGLRRKNDIPTLRPYNSGSDELHRWYDAAFGTEEKPSSLLEIPWDYVESEQENVPFFGVREYWYPILLSDELRANERKCATVCGDNIVLFRGKSGEPIALENRCPHRGPMLSLGSVNAWDVGTITCRYHGMTFDKKGDCVAFLADGPNSPACSKMKVHSYPVEEHGGIIFIYMGVKEEPVPFLDFMPHAREVLHPGEPVRIRKTINFNHLNSLDNALDLTHVGCLHRSCSFFGDQKMGGGIQYNVVDDGMGVYGSLRETGGHSGAAHIDDIRWYMPNLVHHGREFMEGNAHGVFFWWVPRDLGSYTAWMIGSIDRSRVGKLKAKYLATMLGRALESSNLPGMACFFGGDAPIQVSQGRIARWDLDQLTRTDRAVLKCREIMKAAHKADQEERVKRGLDPLAHRVSCPAAIHGAHTVG